MRRLIVITLGLSLLVVSTPANADAGTGSPNMKHVTTLKYVRQWGALRPMGSDIEFASIKGREYAFAGTYQNGLQIIDVTNPRRPRSASVYDCSIAQGDVQIFRRGTRVYVAYAADDYTGAETNPDSKCYRDVGITQKKFGTFIIDVTNPKRPTTVTFVEFPQGSHNQTVHPSGRFLYNSNADLGMETMTPAAIEIVDITNLRDPKKLDELPLITGIESHDITFSTDGKRAYVAALTHTLILDTTNPAKPAIIGRILDPAINIHHQSDPITISDAVLGDRTFLVVTDELAGAAGNGVCPGGGLHVYDITGPLEVAPVKVGFWEMPDARLAVDNLTCTSHVLRMYPKQKLMTIAWYDAGVRVVDVSGLAGASVGLTPGTGNVGVGMREIGYYQLANADTWSAKTNRIERDGSFYLYGNDMNRGLDVYRFDAKAPQSAQAGTWLTPTQAIREAQIRGSAPGSAFAPSCVLRKIA